MEQLRPVWAEINIANLLHNYGEVRRLVGAGVKIMTIVKANAYGHGAKAVAQALNSAGADCFGVAIMNEAVELREAGITKPILVLGWTPAADYERALTYGITLAIFSREEAEGLARIALSKNRRACVHLKVDTGMSRLGFQAESGREEIKKILSLPGLDVEGIFTHLAKADEQDKTYTNWQLERFRSCIKQVEAETGCTFKIKHAANSAAIIDHPEAHFDLVRPGIMLYGLRPSDQVQLSRVDLRQVMALKARVSLVKTVAAGTAVSYGGKYITRGETVIASLPLGYADGYSRLLSGKAEVSYVGQRGPIVGRICMDQLMIDASNFPTPIKQGDVVTLIGQDGDNFISIDELAQLLGTINYEVTCMLSARVPRIYLADAESKKQK